MTKKVEMIEISVETAEYYLEMENAVQCFFNHITSKEFLNLIRGDERSKAARLELHTEWQAKSVAKG